MKRIIWTSTIKGHMSHESWLRAGYSETSRMTKSNFDFVPKEVQ